MNLFGLEITLASKNNKYIKPSECAERHKTLEQYNKTRFENIESRISDLRFHIDNRFNDLKDMIKNNK